MFGIDAYIIDLGVAFRQVTRIVLKAHRATWQEVLAYPTVIVTDLIKKDG